MVGCVRCASKPSPRSYVLLYTGYSYGAVLLRISSRQLHFASRSDWRMDPFLNLGGLPSNRKIGRPVVFSFAAAGAQRDWPPC
jgi:hypothetical protein